jgi:hypothetical protein
MTEFNFDNEAQQTNQELAGQIEGLKPLSDADVSKLFPAPQDQEKVQQLKTIVNAATSQNEKVAALQNNVQQLGGVVVTLLRQII